MSADQEYSDNPAFLLFKALIAKQKTFHATGDGNVGGTTIICSEMAGLPDFDGNQIHIVDPDSNACDQARDIEGATTAGTITVKTAFDCQITENTAFIISGIRSTPVEVANLETWIKATIGDPSGHTLTSLTAKWGDIARSLDLMLGARWDTAGDVGTDVANIIAAISGIQNNTRFTAAVPAWMCKPDAGNEAFRVSSNLYDTEGNMEDPENNEILVRIIKDDGTFITATLYKDNAFVAVLDNPTDTTTFPVASGWRAMEREAAGKFFFFNQVAFDATEESLTVEFGWTEGTKTNYQSRSTEIADVHGDLAAIKTETDKIADATYGLAAQNTYHWDKDISAYTGAKAGTYLKTLYDDWLNGGRLDSLLDACSTHSAADVRQSVCLTGDAASSIGKILYELYINRLTPARATNLDELAAANIPADVDTINTNTDTKVAAKQQIAKTTEDLNQVEATYDLLTGTTQDVLLESLLIRMPNEAAGGAITSISIQTNDATPQVILSAADGAVANLTAEAQLAWQNFNAPILIKVGKKIQLTIAGGAHSTAYVCDVVAKVRAVTSGGYLA